MPPGKGTATPRGGWGRRSRPPHQGPRRRADPTVASRGGPPKGGPPTPDRSRGLLSLAAVRDLPAGADVRSVSPGNRVAPHPAVEDVIAVAPEDAVTLVASGEVVVAGAGVHPVVVVLALGDFGAGAPRDLVLPPPPEESIGPVASEHWAPAARRGEHVVAGASGHLLGVAVRRGEEVVARAAHRPVVARAGEQTVVSVAADDRVVAAVAGEAVVTRAAAEQVVAAHAVDGVVPAEAGDHVTTGGPDQPIVPRGPDDRDLLAPARRARLDPSRGSGASGLRPLAVLGPQGRVSSGPAGDPVAAVPAVEAVVPLGSCQPVVPLPPVHSGVPGELGSA